MPLVVGFLPELLFDRLRLPLVAGAGAALKSDSVDVKVRPVNVAPLHEAHLLCPPCCCLIQSAIWFE
jgi:hypothetical protein